MPDIEDIDPYSRTATIGAISDFYQFLTKVYMKDSQVIRPPPEGWPSIVNVDPADLESFGKSDEVMSLLAHLPYIKSPGNWHKDAEVAPNCVFADWQGLFKNIRGIGKAEDLRVITEGPTFADFNVPHAFGLACGGRDTPVLVLDTQLGIVHWEDVPLGIETEIEGVSYDPDEDTMPEAEVTWRYDAGAWSIPDFFEVLKEQFRTQHWIPISPQMIWSASFTEGEGMVDLLKDVYREHGWPHLDRYRKAECLGAVRKALEEKHPDQVDPRRQG